VPEIGVLAVLFWPVVDKNVFIILPTLLLYKPSPRNLFCNLLKN